MGKTVEQEKWCFAKRHMPAAIESYYNSALRVSIDSGIFNRSDRRDADERYVDKNTITVWNNWLENHGWFVLARDKRQIWSEESGRFLSIPYNVLNHEQWIHKYGTDFCRYYLGSGKWEVPTRSKRNIPCECLLTNPEDGFCSVYCRGMGFTPVTRKWKKKQEIA